MNMESADHGPIEEKYQKEMQALAVVLDEILNGRDCNPNEKKTGFFLTVFPFDDQGRFNYISNAQKMDVRAMCKEVVARIEGRMAREVDKQ